MDLSQLSVCKMIDSMSMETIDGCVQILEQLDIEDNMEESE